MNYVLENQEGIRWYFSLSEDEKIMYVSDESGSWSEPQYMDTPSIKSYSATIDAQGIIRLVAYTTSHQLLYYELNGGGWSSRVVERVYSRYQDISYSSIHSSGSGTHILCYISSALGKSAELLIHYHLYEDKWYGGRLWRFMSHQKTKPQAVSLDEQNRLHLLFTQSSRQNTHFYYSVYDPGDLSWKNPTFIHSSPSLNQYKLYVDRLQNVHLIWTEKVDGQYEVKYLSKLIDDPGREWRETTLYSSPDKLHSPIILDDNELQCVWKEGQFLYKIISKDSGLTWSIPEPLPNALDRHVGLIHYSSFLNGESTAQTLWGRKFPDVELLGLGEDHDEPVADTTNWSHMEQGVSSLRKENSGLKKNMRSVYTQIDQLQSLVYDLQDQVQTNEKSLFNINARLKQLDFKIKQTQDRSRQSHHKVIPNIDERKENRDPRRRFYVKSEVEESYNEPFEQENSREEPPRDQPVSDKSANVQPPIEEKPPKEEPIDKEPPMNIPPSDEGKYPEGKDISDSSKPSRKVVIPVIEDENDEEEERDIERISLGDTTILINPGDPDDY